MGRLVLAPVAVIFLYTSLAASQQPPSTPKAGALELLKRVAQHYAEAKTYALAATEEMSSSSEYDRVWQKTVLAAAQAREGRFYYEGRGAMGGAISASDGKSVWKFHVDENRYTVHAAANNAKEPGMVAFQEMALSRAENLRNQLGSLTRTLRSASLMPEETLSVNGKSVPCLVVRLRNGDENRPNLIADFEKTLWIDKQRETIVRIEEHFDQRQANGVAGRPRTQVTTTMFTKTVLDEPLPDAVFAFAPPPSAHQIAEFPDPRENMMGQSLAGDTLPPLKFKSADGKTVSVESFRGKPLLLDFWATWCAPCVASMPGLAEIYKEGREHGLTMVTVDQDEDAAKAAEFLAKAGYTWPNFHDDGEIEKLMGSSGIPRTVLVDASGRVVYDGAGTDDQRLRTHLEQLGPEFKGLAKAPSGAQQSATAK